MSKNKDCYPNEGLPIGRLGPAIVYRFRRVAAHIAGTTVMDAGCGGGGDFLRLIQNKYQIAGIERVQESVDRCNARLGKEVVLQGNLDDGLDIADGSYDTVVCMEVLEHLQHHQKALEELCRISRKRVIVTVPFKETIHYFSCIHCGRPTPYGGHRHSFDKERLREIVPKGTRIARMELLGNYVCFLPYFLTKIDPFRSLRLSPPPPHPLLTLGDKLLNRLLPRARWIIMVLDKEG